MTLLLDTSRVYCRRRVQSPDALVANGVGTVTADRSYMRRPAPHILCVSWDSRSFASSLLGFQAVRSQTKNGDAVA